MSEIDTMIDLYRQLKAKVSEIEHRHEQELKPFKASMEKILGTVDRFLESNKLVNVKTTYGTAYWKTRWSASLVDPDAFMEFVKAGDRFDLLDRKANVTAVREYAKEHKELPPGAKLDSKRSVHIVKAGAATPDADE